MAQVKNRRTSDATRIIARGIVVGLLLYAAVTIVGLQTQIAEKREQINSLSMRIEEYETSNAALRKEMEAGASDEDIGEVARTELNYAKPGERFFIDPSTRH